jgi:hypothetical protein
LIIVYQMFTKVELKKRYFLIANFIY